MSINKKFPNYSKVENPLRVVLHMTGQNRASRKSEAWMVAHSKVIDRKRRALANSEFSRVERAEKQTRRAFRCITRKKE